MSSSRGSEKAARAGTLNPTVTQEQAADRQFTPLPSDEAMRREAARCRGCDTPLCHGDACVLGNLIPEFLESVSRGRWEEASRTLHSTNNFPEFTGRWCRSPCEPACVQGRQGKPVPIRQLECHVAERAFAEGWIRPLPPARRTGQKVAVIGSGPAGLTIAQQLARAGHEVALFEKDDRAGELLRRGVGGCQVDPYLIERRLRQLAAEGVKFLLGVVVGLDIRGPYLRRGCDAICLTMGTRGSPDAASALTSHSSPCLLDRHFAGDLDLIAQLGLQLDDRGNLPVRDCLTSQSNVFAVDEVVSDLSLVALAIHNGRNAAAVIDRSLQDCNGTREP